MTEPRQLKRGKEFQKQVQEDFRLHSQDGKLVAEAHISFENLLSVSAKAGRADILITELGDFVTVLEIKATDWDRIIPGNVTRNLWRHQRQLFRYVDKFMDVDNISVCLGIIYPEPPAMPGLRERIEGYLESYGVPAYWFNELRSG